MQSIDDVESQHVANLLWASDAVGHPISDTTLEALAEAAVANIGNASPNTLAALVLSCSKLGVTPLEGRLVLAAVEKVAPLPTCFPTTTFSLFLPQANSLHQKNKKFHVYSQCKTIQAG